MGDAILENQFHAKMLSIYAEATRFRYYPSYFLQMVDTQGGLQAARTLLAKPISDGFVRLWKENRLDISVEAVVVQEPWRALFTPEELDTAQSRLDEVGYRPRTDVTNS